MRETIVPGISFTWAPSQSLLETTIGTPIRDDVDLGGFLHGNLETTYGTHKRFVDENSGDWILVDGVAYDYATPATALPLHPRELMQILQHHGSNTPLMLRGSFNILYGNPAQQRAIFINDRKGSRPLVRRRDADGCESFGREIARLATGGPQGLEVDPVGAIEFLIAGAYWEDRTLFQSMSTIPPASIAEITPSAIRWRKYWNYSIEPGTNPRSADDAAEQLDCLIRQAVRRSVAGFSKPLMYLSGGVDSRILLGAICAESIDVTAFSYGGFDGDDHVVARDLARSLRVPLLTSEIRFNAETPDFRPVVMDVDGRAESVDSPFMAEINRCIPDNFDLALNGDELFGWHFSPEHFSTPHTAFSIGLRRLHDVARLMDWIRPEYRQDLMAETDAAIERLLQNCKGTHQQDCLDQLYFTQRMQNYLNPFTAMRTRFREQARPFLDEDVVDFIRRLPAPLRDDKALARHLLHTRYANLLQVPMATRDSIPNAHYYTKAFRSDGGLQSFARSWRGAGLHRKLQEIFRSEAIFDAMNLLTAGKSLPAITGAWWTKLPGAWRFHKPVNAVHPTTLLLRVLQLDTYLKSTVG